MTCRHKMRLDKEIFNRNLPILKTGDHIQMPLDNRCFGTFLKHHAIVKNFDVEDCTPKLSVIEVTVVKEGFVQNRLKIKENEYKRELDQITLVEYRKREYNHLDTYTRARELVLKDNGQVAGGQSYNILTRNCEHFAAACVNGQKKLTFDNFDKSTSLQSSKCFWVVFDIFIAVLQCAFFIMNFYIYAIYVHGKGMEQIFPQFLIHFFNVLQCYHAEQDDLGFMTDCEWKVLAFFEAMFLIFFLCVILPYQYLWLKRYKCVCDECLSARKIIFWVKAFLFAIFETGNKFLERPLYDLIHCLKDNSAITLTICIMISTIEAVFITWVASRLTKCFIFCVGNKHCLKWCCNVCKFEEDAYKYVVRNIHCHDISLCLNDCFLCCGTCIRPQSVPAAKPGPSTTAARVEQQPGPSTILSVEEKQPRPSTTSAAEEKQPRPSIASAAEENQP